MNNNAFLAIKRAIDKMEQFIKKEPDLYFTIEYLKTAFQPSPIISIYRKINGHTQLAQYLIDDSLGQNFYTCSRMPDNVSDVIKDLKRCG